MTDARIFSSNSVTCETSHVKCKTLIQGSSAYKSPNNCRNRSKGSPLRGDSLPKTGNFCHFGGRVPTHGHRLAWNFVRPCGPTCPSAVPNFTWIGATSRPYGAKMLIFGLWVNSIPAVCRLAAILPVITWQPKFISGTVWLRNLSSQDILGAGCRNSVSTNY